MIGIGLEPQPLAVAGWLGCRKRAALSTGAVGWAPSAVAQHVQASVGCDPVQPRPQRRTLLEGLEGPPGRQERLLDGVLGVLDATENPVAVQLQLAPVGVGERRERLLVTCACAAQGAGAHGAKYRIGSH